jgi:formylglycine-generating enzyme required for sulfatase activity
VGGYEDFGQASAPPSHQCDGLPAAKSDENGLAVLVRIDAADGCFWMDQTEVTVSQYSAWLAATDGAAISWETTWCDWKERRSTVLEDPDDECRAAVNSLDFQPFDGRKPMRCVDWCEAEAYCRYAGKHLCRDYAALGTHGPRPPEREWLIACSNAHTTIFPWGNAAEHARCNARQSASSCGSTSGTCGAWPAGSNDECSTPEGVKDLTGNVAEWVFSCDLSGSDTPQPTGCLTRGGAYDEPPLACGDERIVPNDTRLPTLGFRCCDVLTAAETVLVR